MGLILGLDTGIASVGYAVIDSDKNEILESGTRLFESADASRNIDRRTFRGARRTLRRKKYRQKKIAELLNERGFTYDVEDASSENPYELRVRGLREKLSKSEIYMALYNLAKRRGISYLIDALDEESLGYEDSIETNRKLLLKSHPCEIQLERLNKYGKTRGIIEIEEDGKKETLINVFTTSAYEKEARAILAEQKKHYDSIDDEFISEYLDILTRKRPYYVGPGDEKNRTNYGIYKTDGTTKENLFEELIGSCSVYADKKRAPASSYTSQEFNLLNDLNNVKVDSRKLTEEEKRKIIQKIFESKTVSMMNIIKSVANVRKEDITGYRIDKEKKAEFHTFELERKMRKEFGETDLDYKNLSIDQKDELAYTLSVCYDFESLKKRLDRSKNFKSLEDSLVESLFKFRQKNSGNFSKWHSFSVKLMREMREDLYKESKNQMELLIERGIKKSLSDGLSKFEYIPEGYILDEVYNPVVRRSIAQTIKILNSLIKKHGEFEAIVLELPRETNSAEEKKAINNIQKENESEKKKALEKSGVTEKQLSEQRGLMTKIRLWNQQDGRCFYSGESISVQDLVNYPNKYEIDHIVPKSISLDDSLNNKVLVTSRCNQKKGQKTPFQYFKSKDNPSFSYSEFKEMALNLHKSKKISMAKYGLLMLEEDINKIEVRQSFISRNLNDTRYVSKAVLNGLQEFMKHKGKSTEIHVIRGKFTSQLRRRWNIIKDRNESFSHHAVDALVIASSYMIGQSENTVRNPFLQKLRKNQLWKVIDDKKYDKEVYELPWKSFKSDLDQAMTRIKYSHKIDTKVNRKLSDATIYSTRIINSEEKIVEKYKDIYSDDTAKKLIDLIKDDAEKNPSPEDSIILMRRYDTKTFELLQRIIEEYKDARNPFEAYKRDHGYIRKYSKKGNGAIVKDIKFMGDKLGQHIEISGGHQSCTKKAVLLSLKPFRTDLYYSDEKNLYMPLGIKFNDFKFEKGKYVLDLEKYELKKKESGIDESFKFKMSFNKNELIGLKYQGEEDINIYRFLSKNESSKGRIQIKPIEKSDYSKRSDGLKTIGKKVIEVRKYATDILGNIYEVKPRNLKIKTEYAVDNIND